MKRVLNVALASMLALSALGATGAPAIAADLGVYIADQTVCSEAWVRRKIASRFRYQVTHVPNLPDVEILDFYNVEHRRYEPAVEESPIARHYCAADVTLSDGQSRNILYLIEQGQGFASIGDNVEFCVSGFDRWNVYNGRCRVLR